MEVLHCVKPLPAPASGSFMMAQIKKRNTTCSQKQR